MEFKFDERNIQPRSVMADDALAPASSCSSSVLNVHDDTSRL